MEQSISRCLDEGKRMRLRRAVLSIVADYQAFERFQLMNARAGATAWSREREAVLRTKLNDELGDQFSALLACSLICQPATEEDIREVLLSHPSVPIEENR